MKFNLQINLLNYVNNGNILLMKYKQNINIYGVR